MRSKSHVYEILIGNCTINLKKIESNFQFLNSKNSFNVKNDLERPKDLLSCSQFVISLETGIDRLQNHKLVRFDMCSVVI